MSKISVTTITGLTSGGDANKVKIASTDDLVVIQMVLVVDNIQPLITAVGGGGDLTRNGGSSFRMVKIQLMMVSTNGNLTCNLIVVI